MFKKLIVATCMLLSMHAHAYDNISLNVLEHTRDGLQRELAVLHNACDTITALTGAISLAQSRQQHGIEAFSTIACWTYVGYWINIHVINLYQQRSRDLEELDIIIARRREP